MLYNHVDIRNGCYGVIHHDTNGNELYFQPKGKEVKLEKIKVNIENGDICWLVSFDLFGQTKKYEIPRNNISEKKLASYLQSKGADITASSFNSFVDSMRLQEDSIQAPDNIYTRIGWLKLTNNGKIEYAYRGLNLIGGSIPAHYCGNTSLQHNGSFDEWRTMVENEVIGRTALETILLAALSAPIIGIYGLNASTENPIYHINGRSGTGKSTACLLASSVSGEPFEGSRVDYDPDGITKQYTSVYGSWGATAKATITSHAGNRGVVVILNELGKYVGNDMGTLIFNISEGSDIKRLNTQLQTMLSEGFNTTFVSCGEMSLLGRCKSKLEGLKNRVLEICVPLTDDADHSRRIKDSCVRNNGFAAPMIAEYIVDNGGYDLVQQLHSQVLYELTASSPPKISGRFVEKFPTFLVVTAKIAEQALGLKFNVENVVRFCYECALKSINADGDVDASYQDIIEECSINRNNFYVKGLQEPQTVWGAIKYPHAKEGDRVVVIEYGIKPLILKELLAKHGHPNLDTCIDTWKRAGVLNYEKGRNTRSRKTSNAKDHKEELYVLKVFQDCESSSSPEDEVKKRVPSKFLEKLLAEKQQGDIYNTDAKEDIEAPQATNDNSIEVTTDEDTKHSISA